MVIRERYLKLIRPFYDQELIKVLIGIRRSGKTVILKQIIDELKEKMLMIIILSILTLKITIMRNILILKS